MEEKIKQKMDEIAGQWAKGGDPLRPRGTRDGDADRSELAQEIVNEMKYEIIDWIYDLAKNYE